MNHHDHVALLRKGITQEGGTWADLGAGSGAFTLALADLIGGTGTIYAVDKDSGSLRRLAATMNDQFPQIELHCIQNDFARPLQLPLLDGIVMANSLHFTRNPKVILPQIRSYLKPEGKLLLVEYNSDQGNMWVPHPLSYPTWAKLSQTIGFRHTELLATYPSRFMNEIYAAASW